MRPPRERPSTELEGRHQLRRLRAADAGDTRQIVARRARQTVQTAVRGEYSVCDGERAATPAAAAEHERDELVVAKRRGAVTQQLLARPIGRRQFLHLL